MKPATRRRILLASLVVASALPLFGCATPEVMCDVPAYATQTTIAPKGDVRIIWEYGAPLEKHYGITFCNHGHTECRVFIRGEAPLFTDVCGVYVLAHEVLLHGMGATHNERGR